MYRMTSGALSLAESRNAGKDRTLMPTIKVSY
jgi:hypothetical protein